MILRRSLKIGRSIGASHCARSGGVQASYHPAHCCSSWCCFTFSPFKDFKHVWGHGVERAYRDCFGARPSYGRFVAQGLRFFTPFCVLMHSPSGEAAGVYVADSPKLAVCASQRIPRNRTFKGCAARGHSTMGGFFGVKLYVVMKHKGELMAIKITPGNVQTAHRWK